MVIGKDNSLPWPRIPGDMKHFKRLTERWPVIMGRKTWESIPEEFRPLSNRTNIVITRKPDDMVDFGARFCNDIRAALKGEKHWNKIFIIGGGSVYEWALEEDIVDTMWITNINGDFPGDVKFPKVDWNQWTGTWCGSGKHQGIEYSFWCYERRKVDGKPIYATAA